jgi:hypothetical protein
MNYVSDKFMWTDNQTSATVNWRAMGIEKKATQTTPIHTNNKNALGMDQCGQTKRQDGEDMDDGVIVGGGMPWSYRAFCVV